MKSSIDLKMPITLVINVCAAAHPPGDPRAGVGGHDREHRVVAGLPGLLEDQVDAHPRRTRRLDDLHAALAGPAVPRPGVDRAGARLRAGVGAPELGVHVLPRRPAGPAAEVRDLVVDAFRRRLDRDRALDGVRVALPSGQTSTPGRFPSAPCASLLARLPRRHPVTDTEARVEPMTFCVVGAGAVGGQIGARLAASGQPTSALARGETLAALRDHGWRLRRTDGLVQGPVRASADATELGPHDVVVLAVKGPSLPSVAPHLPALMHPGTVVVTAVNGVPWWFFQRFGGRYEGLPLRSVDPDGVLARTIPVTHVLGCRRALQREQPEPGRGRRSCGSAADPRRAGRQPLGAAAARLERVARWRLSTWRSPMPCNARSGSSSGAT